MNCRIGIRVRVRVVAAAWVVYSMDDCGMHVAIRFDDITERVMLGLGWH